MLYSNNIPGDLLTHSAYYAFKLLGNYLWLENTFMIAYAAMCAFLTFAVTVISIDEPLRTLLTRKTGNISLSSYKKITHGNCINAYCVVLCIVGVMPIIHAFGIPNVDEQSNGWAR